MTSEGSSPPAIAIALAEKPPAGPVSLTLVDAHREIPIYLLAYPSPTILNRSVHEAELLAIEALPDARLALAVNYQNLIFTGEYPTEDAVEVQLSVLGQQVQRRLAAVARYAPSSLTALIRTMVAHLYAHQGAPSAFAPDLEGALALLRRAIDRALASPPPGH